VFVGGEEDVSQTGILLPVSNLLEHVRQQVLGGRPFPSAVTDRTSKDSPPEA
jgi:hypothetical protein